MILSGVGVVKHFGLNCNYDGCNFTPGLLKLVLQGGDKLLSCIILQRFGIQQNNLITTYIDNLCTIEVFRYQTEHILFLQHDHIYTSSRIRIPIASFPLLLRFRQEIESCFYLKEAKNDNI